MSETKSIHDKMIALSAKWKDDSHHHPKLSPEERWCLDGCADAIHKEIGPAKPLIHHLYNMYDHATNPLVEMASVDWNQVTCEKCLEDKEIAKYQGHWNNNYQPNHWFIEGKQVYLWYDNGIRSRYGYTSFDLSVESINMGDWWKCDEHGKRLISPELLPYQGRWSEGGEVHWSVEGSGIRIIYQDARKDNIFYRDAATWVILKNSVNNKTMFRCDENGVITDPEYYNKYQGDWVWAKSDWKGYYRIEGNKISVVFPDWKTIDAKFGFAKVQENISSGDWVKRSGVTVEVRWDLGAYNKLFGDWQIIKDDLCSRSDKYQGEWVFKTCALGLHYLVKGREVFCCSEINGATKAALSFDDVKKYIDNGYFYRREMAVDLERAAHNKYQGYWVDDHSKIKIYHVIGDMSWEVNHYDHASSQIKSSFSIAEAKKNIDEHNWFKSNKWGQRI